MDGRFALCHVTTRNCSLLIKKIPTTVLCFLRFVTSAKKSFSAEVLRNFIVTVLNPGIRHCVPFRFASLRSAFRHYTSRQFEPHCRLSISLFTRLVDRAFSIVEQFAPTVPCLCLPNRFQRNLFLVLVASFNFSFSGVLVLFFFS